MAAGSRFFVLMILGALSAFIFQFYASSLNELVTAAFDEYGNELLIRGYIPDSLLRAAIRYQLRQRLDELTATFNAQQQQQQTMIDAFVEDLKHRPSIAEATQDANAQHYEVDTAFYDPILGFFKKYSSTIYLTESEKNEQMFARAPCIDLHTAYEWLNASEVDMMTLYMSRLELCAGEKCALKLLDLGCGWGSFSLFYASQCPNCEIVSISNSASQVEYINSHGQSNVRAMKQDVNQLDEFATKIGMKFDRVISIEMFEHMKNYKLLLHHLRALLQCNGKLFVHMFVHKNMPYHFESGWMSKYFFAGGTMLSHQLLARFDDDFEMQQSWIVNGVHYSYTLETWLHEMDKNSARVKKAIGNIYGDDDDVTVTKWWYLWRTFFIACSELFKYDGGDEWFVGNYLLTPKCWSVDGMGYGTP